MLERVHGGRQGIRNLCRRSCSCCRYLGREAGNPTDDGFDPLDSIEQFIDTDGDGDEVFADERLVFAQSGQLAFQRVYVVFDGANAQQGSFALDGVDVAGHVVQSPAIGSGVRAHILQLVVDLFDARSGVGNEFLYQRRLLVNHAEK